jgi:hypothetical protein
MMTPQLFINYKLKSVAHLPWRMLSYKFLNTFIDDIFAFVIKMPTLYRLGCFRDGMFIDVLLLRRCKFCGSMHETYNLHLPRSEKIEVLVMESTTLERITAGFATCTSL